MLSSSNPPTPGPGSWHLMRQKVESTQLAQTDVITVWELLSEGLNLSFSAQKHSKTNKNKQNEGTVSTDLMWAQGIPRIHPYKISPDLARPCVANGALYPTVTWQRQGLHPTLFCICCSGCLVTLSFKKYHCIESYRLYSHRNFRRLCWKWAASSVAHFDAISWALKSDSSDRRFPLASAPPRPQQLDTAQSAQHHPREFPPTDRCFFLCTCVEWFSDSDHFIWWLYCEYCRLTFTVHYLCNKLQRNWYDVDFWLWFRCSKLVADCLRWVKVLSFQGPAAQSGPESACDPGHFFLDPIMYQWFQCSILGPTFLDAAIRFLASMLSDLLEKLARMDALFSCQLSACQIGERFGSRTKLAHGTFAECKLHFFWRSWILRGVRQCIQKETSYCSSAVD